VGWLEERVAVAVALDIHRTKALMPDNQEQMVEVAAVEVDRLATMDQTLPLEQTKELLAAEAETASSILNTSRLFI
jgi:hypothetical protein